MYLKNIFASLHSYFHWDLGFK